MSEWFHRNAEDLLTKGQLCQAGHQGLEVFNDVSNFRQFRKEGINFC